MRKILISLFLIFSFIVSTFNFLVAGNEGTSGAVILSQPIGAKASAMAEAYTALSGDINCLYYNPAGLTYLNRKQASLTYQRGIAGDEFGIVNFGLPKVGETFAVSLIYYTIGDIELLDDSGNLRTVDKAQEDYLVTLSYSRHLNTNFSLGLSGKFLDSTLIEDFSANAFAIDFGVLYNLRNFSFGFAVQNIGTKLNYGNKGDSLPMNTRVGISYHFNNLTLGLDIIKPNDDNIKENIGIEYVVKNLLSLRAGYKFGYDLESLTFGFGFNLKDFNIDYGITKIEVLDITHKVSLTYNF
jgi:long-subunit fatty acid transport protein